MSKESLKIIIALVVALLLTQLLSRFFLANSPRFNRFYLAGLFARKPTPLSGVTGPLSGPTPEEPPTPTILAVVPTATIIPTKTIATRITPTVYIKPTIKPTLSPTSPPSFSGCPAISTQSYRSIRTDHTPGDGLFGDPATSPEINVRLRGWTQVNEGTGLISRNGSTYGLDPVMPPQISSLYGGPVPQIVKTYRVYEWDFDNHRSGAPATATPAYPVHMLGLQATPGQPLLGLKAGRDIGGGNVFMVLYATPTDITFSHSNGDTLLGGYLFFFEDICVDPNLLAKYNENNAAGRNELPVIATGQVFGYAGNTDVKSVVRDTMSFMDTRYKEDWWFYGQ